MMTRVLIAGASGILGGYWPGVFCRGAALQLVMCLPYTASPTDLEVVQLPMLETEKDWRKVVERVKTNLHYAGCVHVMKDDAPSPPDEFRRVNVRGTINLVRKTGLEVVTIRPPLIYELGAPGNSAQLLQIVNLRFPLSFGRLHNLRSFVVLDNVVDLIF